MAMVARHIRSNYNAEEDRTRLELETGQLEADAIAEANPGGVQEEEDRDPWLIERPFGTSARILRPPRFVPATIDYDEWGFGSFTQERVREKNEEEDKDGVAGWYRSLARKPPGGTPRSGTPASAPQTPPTMMEKEPESSRKSAVKKDRNNWFIARVLEASASASVSALASASTSASSSGTNTPPSGVPAPAPTLADILARDPPPLPTEQKYTPPVWLAIGPSNRGFAMLQKSGWEEGEALGRASRNRSGLGYREKGKEKEVGNDDEDECSTTVVKREVIDLASVDHEIVDLTLSDDEEERPDLTSSTSQPQSPPSTTSPSASVPIPRSSSTDLDHAPRALLTPLPTVLKSDRLGIGLKAKYTGSGIYRAPVKRVTHSQASLEAHVRAAEKQRRMKELVGRGRRGFERVKKREEEKRRALLAYLNT
ncbi:hypothetical protein A7U60_g3909 [Sanghuangporus baumii]|uniref:G-patch domain-containing protein n=1 Tax=Sanghuangporus baumii TaxID=108892 RepID=A0A9Q5NCS7_SANBA|nr:hypothetical protein A7U60_g3909 [Sanghuangporus baumii]